MARLVTAIGMVVLPSTLAIAQQSGATNWWRQTRVVPTKYYAMKTDLPKEQATELAQHMDATCESYVQTFSNLPVRVRRPAALGLFLFADEDDYLQTLRTHFRADGTGSWGLCITRGNTISLAGYRGNHSTEEMKPLLQHEGFHQFAAQLFPNMPKWANEGLAEVFERGVVVNDTLVLGNIEPRDRQALLRAISSNEALSLMELLSIGPRGWNQHVVEGNAQTQYLQAWNLVQYLLFADDGKHQKKFLGFLVQLNARSDWRKAFMSTFGYVDLKELEQDWISYGQRTPASDLRQRVREMQYLAEGMQHLREKGIFPTSQDELRRALAESNFVYTSELYDKTVRLTASNPMLSTGNAAEIRTRRRQLNSSFWTSGVESQQRVTRISSCRHRCTL